MMPRFQAVADIVVYLCGIFAIGEMNLMNNHRPCDGAVVPQLYQALSGNVAIDFVMMAHRPATQYCTFSLSGGGDREYTHDSYRTKITLSLLSP